MKYFIGGILALVVVALVFQILRKDKAPDKETPVITAATVHNVKILEVIQATSYTYMRVSEDKKEYWVATIKDDAVVGGDYSYGEALEMNNFTSKELDRTFPVIYFISEDAGMGGGEPAAEAAPMTMGKPKVEQNADVVIPQSDGGVSIGELYKNRNKYSNQKVRVKGKVVKVNKEVMGKNWVHLQDGTSDSGSFDLTVTTLETASVGDILEFEGTIILNKDFGAGYTYDLIMEGGVIRK
jgi:hypothetical protein